MSLEITKGSLVHIEALLVVKVGRVLTTRLPSSHPLSIEKEKQRGKTGLRNPQHSRRKQNLCCSLPIPQGQWLWNTQQLGWIKQGPHAPHWASMKAVQGLWFPLLCCNSLPTSTLSVILCSQLLWEGKAALGLGELCLRFFPNNKLEDTPRISKAVSMAQDWRVCFYYKHWGELASVQTLNLFSPILYSLLLEFSGNKWLLCNRLIKLFCRSISLANKSTRMIRPSANTSAKLERKKKVPNFQKLPCLVTWRRSSLTTGD